MLNEEQINRLYKFCVQHYVRYYDVQIELVDHLANAVETKMEADKNLDFETALISVYAGFGISGFSKIVQQRTDALSKECVHKKWQYFKAFFTIPKIIVTILLFAIFSTAYRWINKSNLVGFLTTISLLFSLAVIGFLAYSAVKYEQPKKELLQTKGKWNIVAPINSAALLPNYFVTISGRKNAEQILINNPVWYFIIAAFIVLLLILSIASVQVYIELEKSARKNYPLAFE